MALSLARTALPPMENGPDWRPVVQCRTPWGEVVRLRPFLQEIEIRGADCVLHLDRQEWSLEGDPGRVDWKGITADLSRWKSEGERTLRNRTGIAALAPSVGSDQKRNAAGVPTEVRYFVELEPEAARPWILGAELRLDTAAPATHASLSALPWSGEKPALSGALELRIELDPSTLTVLGVRDLRLYDRDPEERPLDSSASVTGTGLLFDPNPVVSGGGPDLRDGDAVDAYRRWLPIPRLDGSGFLRGRWIETATDRPPQAAEPGLVFSYPSYDPRFEEGMAYLHGDRALERVDSLGFHGLFDRPLTIRVHGTELDNSWYSRPRREVVLGDGGVDDGEDADIILHEVGHAIHEALVPGFGSGNTLALSEGFGDFWAASLTGGACVGDWDATSYSPPCLRQADGEEPFTGTLTGRAHLDGGIWSGLLWEIRSAVGARETEQLSLAAFLEQGTSTTFPEAARGLLRSGERLGWSAESRAALSEILARRGLLPREIRFTLSGGETRRLALVSASRFLSDEVGALELHGDGRMVFAPVPVGLAPPAGAAPVSPPAFTPCGIDPVLARGRDAAAWIPASWSLHVEGTLDGHSGDLRLAWKDGERVFLRCAILWNPADGSLSWTYLELDPALSGLSLAAALLSSGADPGRVTDIELTELSPDGISGLSGFRGSVDGGEGLLGARFAVSAGPDEPGFRLRKELGGVRVRAGAILLQAHPNPFRGQAELRLYLRRPGPARLEVFGVDGRRIRLLAEERFDAGVTLLSWDGREDSGRPAPAGVYWIRAAGSGADAQLRLLRLR